MAKSKKGKNNLLLLITIAVVMCGGALMALISVSSSSPSFFSILATLLSALLGALIVLLTTTLTLNRSQKQIDEQHRLQSLPFINAIDNPGPAKNISNMITIDKDKKCRFSNLSDGTLGCFNLINIGVAPAIGIKFSNLDLWHLSVSEGRTLIIEVSEKGSSSFEIPIEITYKDREERSYQQTLILFSQEERLRVKSISVPVPIAT